MSDFIVLFIIVAMVLAFISTLLYISLRSQGVAASRVTWLIVELWATFIVIIGIFYLLSRFLGPTPAGEWSDELLMQFSRWQQLTTGQQVAIVLGLLVALALFAHLIWSLRNVQRRSTMNPPTTGGDVS